jgi:HSF-type DNA-binding
MEYIVAQEQRRQALFASQQNALNINAAACDRLGALMMQRESLLGGGGGFGGLTDQALLARLAAAGGFAGAAAGLPPSLGISALGMNSALTRGLVPSQAFASPLLMRAQQQLAGFRDPASMALSDHLVPLLDGSDRSGRKGRTGTFPQKLHLMLSDLEGEEGGRDIASWLPHGRAFAIHKPKEFVKSVMPKYFRMSRFSSFQRQLNLYEFQRITEGPDKGGK